MTNANDFMNDSNGSDTFYDHWLKPFVFTSGIKELADKCQCYWLIDVVVSHQANPNVARQPFQVWKLKRIHNNRFMVICEDGNDNQVTSQLIPFSDFPYDLATLWLSEGCLMLPAEY